MPSAASLGIERWQTTTKQRDEFAFLERGALSRGSLQTVATTRPALTVFTDDDGVDYLVGPVEPGDGEAITGILSSVEVRANGMSSVPPAKEITSLARTAAAVVQLVSNEPSADALLGRGADPAITARLERAASAWPDEARVWRVIGTPPDSKEEAGVAFGPENDPEDSHDEDRHRRLRGVGLLEFAPTQGGGLGDLIGASVSIVYQNSGQNDLELTVRFLYDRGTDQWILSRIHSAPSRAVMIQIASKGDNARLNNMTHSLDFLSVLPECLIVVGPDGPLLCK